MQKQFYVVVLYFLSLQICRAQHDPVPGIITDTVYCDGSSINSYCLYLPSSYSPALSYPVLFIHDPAARGHLAVSVFEKAAEEYNYILCCSYMTQNDMPMQKAIDISAEMQRDARKKFSIDTNNVFVCGFSGGSRLACAIAMQQKNIAGIVACGAGLPVSPFNINDLDKDIIYAATAGTYDMNFLEMYDLCNSLEKNSVTSRFFEFNGGHEWCDTLTAIHILSWLKLRALQKEHTLINTVISQPVIKHDIFLFTNAFSVKDHFKACREYAYLLQDTAGSIINYELPQFDTTGCRLEKDKIEKLFSREKEQRNTYITYLAYRLPGTYISDSSMLKNDAWWKQMSGKLKKQARDSATAEGRSAARLYDILWRSCWEQGEIYYNDRKYNTARELFYLYTLINGESKYAWLMLAKTDARLGSESAAIKDLQIAYEKGFKNAELLKTDEAFSALQMNKKFLSLLEEMKKAN